MKKALIKWLVLNNGHKVMYGEKYIYNVIDNNEIFYK